MSDIRVARLLSAACGVSLALLGAQVHGATATDDFQVRITIENSCVISTAVTDMDFGTRQLLTSNTDTGQSSFAVNCTTDLPYTMSLNAGSNSTGGTTGRRMANAGSFVAYDLFQDTGRTQHWGNTVGTDSKAGTGNGAPQIHQIYGRVGTQTTPAAGTYIDTVQLTVTY